MNRRSFLRNGLAVAGVTAGASCARNGTQPQPSPGPSRERVDLAAQFRHLTPMTAGIAPITDDERQARIERARRLMSDRGLAGMFLESGSSLFYYTGVRWGLSERPFGVVIPVRGELGWVVPAFEEQRARELLPSSADLRVWQEDESPYRVIAGVLRDRGAAAGTIGIEERVRFFVFDGLRAAMGRAQFVTATPVTAGGRMIKSPAEIALLERANAITVRAIDEAIRTLRPGMSQHELAASVSAATTALGGNDDGALVAFGKESAFPHGSSKPQQLREGDVVLVDAGCRIQGYLSDVTRTIVYGTPSQRQRDVWDVEKRAQRAAYEAAQPGATCESVDGAARRVITEAGFGPGYKLPGLPHRTGHGIGLDGHEWTNLVKGNTTPLEPGMCFSDEPTIAIYGEFGIRLEDCLHVTDKGPVFFTPQSESIDKPFG
jgi:Xaa-Pro dipeptidase